MRKIRSIYLAVVCMASMFFSAEKTQAQNDPRMIRAGEEIKRISLQAAVHQPDVEGFTNHTLVTSRPISGVGQAVQYFSKFGSFHPALRKNAPKTRGYDTLWIFQDTTISGTFTHTGPVFIVYDGVLRIQNAQFINYGDIILWGTNPRLIVNNSYLNFPQEYFYQRGIMAYMNGHISIMNSTLDYSGLSHNLALANNSDVYWKNVTNIGFTTTGLYGNTKFRIDGTNQAGEFVITDSAIIDFSRANTILLWHQFPDGAMVDHTFPYRKDSVLHYAFNPNTPGVSGIGYDINIDSCTDLMWALMPSAGSDVTIRNSDLRAIGLWFERPDSVSISGLVNNNYYSDISLSLSDRNLRLEKTSVMTWSLYPMRDSKVTISGSIVGEIGAMGRSAISGSNFTVDGSGGYYWVTDTTIAFNVFTTAFNDIRSDKNGIFVFAYSSLVNGMAMALKNSVMVIIQSLVPELPVAYEQSVVWYLRVDGPSKAHTGQLVPVMGSAWIDQADTSGLMDWKYYSMYYQQSGSATWNKIAVDSLVETRDDTLCLWNTTGLSTGQYTLKLIVTDNWGNNMEAVKGVNLLPEIIPAVSQDFPERTIAVYPNPANEILNVSDSQFPFNQYVISDIYGRTLVDRCLPLTTFTGIDIHELPQGVYFCTVRNSINGMKKSMLFEKIK